MEPARQQAWEAVRGRADIQYAPLPPAEPPRQPEWLKTLGEWLEALFGPLGRLLGLNWPVMEAILIGLAVLLALWLGWRLARGWLDRRRPANPGDEAAWTPGEARAAALLDDADRLAAEGRFAEAVHLLLRRSVAHIAETRPEWLIPASTAREIAVLPLLPEAARRAFAVIAARVERSRYALCDLDEADWRAARSAYADFALQPMAREPA